MYQDSNMLASIRKVEAAREENAKLDPRRMTAEEKETLLKKFHPDYRAEQFTELRFGPNQGIRSLKMKKCYQFQKMKKCYQFQKMKKF